MTSTFMPLTTVLYCLLTFRKNCLVLALATFSGEYLNVSLRFLSGNSLFDPNPTCFANSSSYITWDGSFATLRSWTFSLPRSGRDWTQSSMLLVTIIMDSRSGKYLMKSSGQMQMSYDLAVIQNSWFCLFLMNFLQQWKVGHI